VSIFTYCLLYILAGFVQEALITSFHRSVIAEKNVLAACLSSSITILSLLVITGIIRKILDPTTGYWVFLYVLIFTIGKGLGGYCSLTWWSKKALCDEEKGDCKRKDL